MTSVNTDQIEEISEKIASLEGILSKIPDLRSDEIEKLTVLSDDEIMSLRRVIQRERDRQVIDQWLANIAIRTLKSSSWILGVSAGAYLMWDHFATIVKIAVSTGGKPS